MSRFSTRSPKPPKPHPALEGPQLQAVADLFAVLSEPTRLRILQHLQHGPASVGALCEALQIKQANASKQLGILSAAGVVERAQDGNRAIYSIAMPVIFELCGIVCASVADQAERRAAALRG